MSSSSRYTSQVQQWHSQLAPTVPIDAFVSYLDPELLGLENRAQFYAPVEFAVHVQGPISGAAGSVRLAVPVHANPDWLSILQQRIGAMFSRKQVELRTMSGKPLSQVPLDDLERAGKLGVYVDGKRTTLETLPQVPLEYSINKLNTLYQWFGPVKEHLTEFLSKELLRCETPTALIEAIAPNGSLEKQIAQQLHDATHDWNEFVRVNHMNSPYALEAQGAQAVLYDIASSIRSTLSDFIQASADDISSFYRSVEAERMAQKMGQDAFKPLYGSLQVKATDGFRLYNDLCKSLFDLPVITEEVVNAIYLKPIEGCRWERGQEPDRLDKGGVVVAVPQRREEEAPPVVPVVRRGRLPKPSKAPPSPSQSPPTSPRPPPSPETGSGTGSSRRSQSPPPSPGATPRQSPRGQEEQSPAVDVPESSEGGEASSEESSYDMSKIRELIRNLTEAQIQALQFVTGKGSVAKNSEILEGIGFSKTNAQDIARKIGAASKLEPNARIEKLRNIIRRRIIDQQKLPSESFISSHNPYNAHIHHTLKSVGGGYPSYYMLEHTQRDLTEAAPFAGDVDETYRAYHMFANAHPMPEAAPIGKHYKKKEKKKEKKESQAPAVRPIQCAAKEEDDEDMKFELPPLIPYRKVGTAAPPVRPIECGAKEEDDEDMKFELPPLIPYRKVGTEAPAVRPIECGAGRRKKREEEEEVMKFELPPLVPFIGKHANKEKEKKGPRLVSASVAEKMRERLVRVEKKIPDTGHGFVGLPEVDDLF